MEPQSQLPTFFASAERASREELERLAELCLGNPVSVALLEAVSGLAMILNAERQVVAANTEALEILGVASPDLICGLRLGEAFGCVHVPEGPGGCGTSKACAQCGAALATLDAQTEGRFSQGECLLTLSRGKSILSREYKIRASPIQIGGQQLTLIVLQDRSGQKRREVLEHLVFQEFQGLVQGVDTRMQELVVHPEQAPATAQQIQHLTARLGEELAAHRILLSAEEGHLLAEPRDFTVKDLFQELEKRFREHPVSAGREWLIDAGPRIRLRTDYVLLTRVLANLVRNAFEATPKGQTVRLLCRSESAKVRIEVWNPGEMAEPVRLRIFQRSFSTKAAKGRGLGTYSARLLAEGFLDGHLSFTSGSEGTCFCVELPFDGEETSVPASPEAPPVREQPGPAREGGVATVLVVDDSRTVRNLLANTLSREHKIMTASDGQEAIRIAVELQPDLILLDAIMPGLDGFATCARLKSEPRTEEIPVLFLSGLSGEDDETLALEAGAIDFIPKPIRPVVVAARVRNQLELKRTRDRLRDLTLLDGLTGIANRRRFDRQLQIEWLRSRRGMQPLSVILGDVDFFKRYNDGYGHAQGDECLKSVARCFSQALMRPGDLAARYGGEEFVCILPDTTLEGALEVAERIRQRLKDLALPHVHSEAGPCVSVSLGVASVHPDEDQSPLELIERADLKLYKAKEQGRDRVAG